MSVRWILALLAALLLPPSASAGLEQFSHRVAIVGRVIDADGLAAPGWVLSADFHGLDVGGTCFDTKDTTDATGDFHLCRYAREIPPNVTATLRVGNVSSEVRIDERLRQGIAYVQVPEHRDAASAGDDHFAGNLHVAGRIFYSHPEGLVVDGIAVNATPLQGLNVTVRVASESGPLGNANATTNSQGDYAVDVPVGTLPNGTRVIVEAGGRVQFAEAIPRMRRVDVTMIHAALPVAPRPGSESPKIPDGLWITPVAGLLACAAWRSRRLR